MIYALVNIIFSLSCFIGLFFEDNATLGNIFYLILIFAMSSSSLLFRNPLYGRYLLYTLFLGYCFLTYALFEYVDLFLDFDIPAIGRTNEFFPYHKVVILIGIFSFIGGYIITEKFVSSNNLKLISRNWNYSLIPILAIIFWLIGALITIDWDFSQSTGNSIFGSLGKFGGVYATMRYLMILGEIMIIYSFIMRKNKLVGILVLCILFGDIIVGFIVDSKEVAFRVIAIYLVSSLMLKGRLNIKLAAIGFLVMAIGFSVFSQYRIYLQERNLSDAKAFENVGQNISRALSSSGESSNGFSRGLNYLLQRMSLTGSTEMVVVNTGNSVEFRNGNTLTPVVYAFLPRFILPDKPDPNIGRLVNNVFKVSESPDTYISIGHLAEFYWNFGVYGVIIGMMIVGFVLSLVSYIFDLRKYPVISRFLMILITVYILILRFEGGAAQTYILWSRLMLILLFIHLIIPKQKISSKQRTI